MQPGSTPWISATAGLTLIQIAASVLLKRGLALTATTDILSAALVVMLLLASAGNAVFAQGRLRAVWILQAGCWALWLADQCGWILYDVVLRKPMPDMFPGDVLLFLGAVPILAGLLLRPHLEPSKRSIRLGMLDFLLLLLWWIYFYVYLVMCWQYVSMNLTFYNRNYDRLYLLEVVILLTVLGLLLKQSAGAWRRFYALFLVAVLFNSAIVIAGNHAIETKVYYSGSWYDAVFAASLGFFMVVPITGRGLTPVPETASDKGYGSWMASLAVLAVLSLPVIAVAAVIDTWAPPEIVRFRVLITAITMFLMAALVFVKQRRLHEELRQTNAVLEEASMTDPLTGIRNRRFFSATIESDIAQTIRTFAQGVERSTRDLVFYLIDLDNFKEVNDLYGHDAGDRVLVETARRIGSAVRASDVLLRWGGEEFLIISRSTDRRDANALALRVMEAIRGEPFTVSSSHTIRRTCSIGWAAFPWLEENVGAVGYEEVLNLADRALSQAKKSGKDRAIGMTPSHGEVGASAGSHRDPGPVSSNA